MKHYITHLLPAVTLGLMLLNGCGSSSNEPETVDDVTVTAPSVTADDTVNYVKLKVNPLGGSLASVFNDINSVQLPAAEELGIKPVNGVRDAWNVTRPLKEIGDCDEYVVDELTHSVPYLVPEAAELLKEIGRRFNDSLAARGGGGQRIKVTSVLRTEGAVSKLRRQNINATANSAHRYGTTFDISYINFNEDNADVPRTQEDLKNLLGEILKSVRDEQKCYVKFERKQGCFHITARKQK